MGKGRGKREREVEMKEREREIASRRRWVISFAPSIHFIHSFVHSGPCLALELGFWGLAAYVDGALFEERGDGRIDACERVSELDGEGSFMRGGGFCRLSVVVDWVFLT